MDDPFAFPTFFEMYRKSGVSIEEIVRRVTSLPAEQFRIKGRGLLEVGKAADIAVIDIARYKFPSPTEADYKDPLKTADGVRYVLVNGQIVLGEEGIKASFPGQVILNK